jgi:hypothetical protein
MVGRMEEARPKLDLSAVDLADVALALEDHSEDQTWRFDPVDGTVAPFFSSSLEQPGDQSAADELIAIEPLPSAVGYRDMEDFAVRVRDPRLASCWRAPSAAGGRFGASRTCSSSIFPSYVGRGSPSTTYAGERRAIEWLADRNLIAREAAADGLAQRPDPELAGLPSLLRGFGLQLGLGDRQLLDHRVVAYRVAPQHAVELPAFVPLPRLMHALLEGVRVT